MNKISFLLIYLLCFKRISPEPCTKFDSWHQNWFTECNEPPCTCTGINVYCVMDEERECIGCARSDYKGSCSCSGDGCRCVHGGRQCNNYCVAREETCDGRCQGDDSVCNKKCISRDEFCCEGDYRDCNGQCIGRNEVCNGKHCGELDWVCNGECIPQITTCYGKSYSAEGCGEGQWKCNGVCIADHQECNKKCNEALGYWMCGSHCRKGGQDRWESNGLSCLTKSTNNDDCLENEWECDKKCIKRDEACNGMCHGAEGDWKCGRVCKNQEDRGDWITDGEACNPQPSPITTTITANGISPLHVMIIVGVSSGVGFALLVAVIIAICIYCKNKKKGKEIQYIDDNPEYNYGEADDDIEVVDYNEYYGDSDEETHV